MYYEEVFQALNKKGIRYLVVGGIAVNLYGVPRMTADLDILVALDSTNLSKFIAVVTELGYKPRAPINPEDLVAPHKRKEWQAEKKAVVFSFTHVAKPYQEIDIFLENPIDFEKAYASKKILQVSAVDIPLASLHDLQLIKQKSGRKQDLSDIEALKRIEKVQEEGQGGDSD